MPIAFTPSPFCPAFRRVPLSSHKGGALLDYWPREGAATVLFVPGTMLGPLQYRVFLHALYEQGLAVAALHLTGHGATRHILSFRLPQLLDDVRQAVVHLRQRHSGPLLLCGHSQGGIMTLALACGGSLPDGNGRHIAFAPLDGVAAFSTTPLAIASVLGVLFCLLALVLTVVVVVRAILFGDPVAGWPSLMTAILLVGGAQLLCLGVIGQYLAKTYVETKHRPIYLAREQGEGPLPRGRKNVRP